MRNRQRLHLPSVPLPKPRWRICTDNLVNGFVGWSWATRNLGNASPTHSGSNSISVTPAAWTAPSFQHSDFSAVAWGSLTFWANGGSGEGRARHSVRAAVIVRPSGRQRTARPTCPDVSISM